VNAVLPFRILACAMIFVGAACSSSDGQSPDAGSLRWYTTCGYPICGPFDAGMPTGVTACSTEREGTTCATGGATCDPGTGCGVLLRCTDKDPRTQPGGCPISRLASKRDVRYLNEADLAGLEAQVRAIRLARYRYKDAPTRERLGFIIDDVPASPAVDEPRDMIDLYAYTSMVVAAVQRQAQRLEAQDREIGRLHRELDQLRAAAPARHDRRTVDGLSRTATTPVLLGP